MLKLLKYIILIFFFMNASCVHQTNQQDMNKEKSEKADKYLSQLNSKDELKRSDAAIQLHKLNHPDALNACIKTINDDEDKLHLDYTPSVHCLIEIGEPALLPLTDLLLSDDEYTRLRASRAVEEITINIWNREGGNNKKQIIEEWKKWWIGIGYSYEGGETSSRTQSVDALREWIGQRKKQK